MFLFLFLSTFEFDFDFQFFVRLNRHWKWSGKGSSSSSEISQKMKIWTCKWNWRMEGLCREFIGTWNWPESPLPCDMLHGDVECADYTTSSRCLSPLMFGNISFHICVTHVPFNVIPRYEMIEWKIEHQIEQSNFIHCALDRVRVSRRNSCNTTVKTSRRRAKSGEEQKLIVSTSCFDIRNFILFCLLCRLVYARLMM